MIDKETLNAINKVATYLTGTQIWGIVPDMVGNGVCYYRKPMIIMHNGEYYVLTDKADVLSETRYSDFTVDIERGDYVPMSIKTENIEQ